MGGDGSAEEGQDARGGGTSAERGSRQRAHRLSLATGKVEVRSGRPKSGRGDGVMVACSGEDGLAAAALLGEQ